MQANIMRHRLNYAGTINNPLRFPFFIEVIMGGKGVVHHISFLFREIITVIEV